MLTMITISRAEVVAGNAQPLVTMLRKLTASPVAWRRMRGTFLFCIDGWNDDPREVYEIPEVRAYWAKVDATFPAWSYFVSGEPLAVFALCLLPSLRVVSSGRIGEVASVDFASADMAAFVTRTRAAVESAASKVGLESAHVQAYRNALVRACCPRASVA